MDLKQKKAVVTGASRGIGRATALALAEKGVCVWMCSRDGAKLGTLVEEILEAGGTAQSVPADLTQQDEVVRVFDMVGELDILVNSAGIGRIAPVCDGDPDDWRAMWEINVIGLALCSREALPRFPKTGGHIVNLGSLSGHRVPSTGGFYSATKFAVRAMTEALRIELCQNRSPTRVTHVSPGFVDTGLVDEYLSAKGKTRADLGIDLIPPDEVARTVVHALEAPDGVVLNDIVLRPLEQES